MARTTDFPLGPLPPIPPGETLAEELETRHWSRGALAHHANLGEREIDALIDAAGLLGPREARRLARALGSSSRMWLNLEANFRAALAREAAERADAAQAERTATAIAADAAQAAARAEATDERAVAPAEAPGPLPARNVSPGRIVQRELDARGWSRDTLARRTGFTGATLARILDADGDLDASEATALGLAFGTTDQFWLDLDAAHRRDRAAGAATFAGTDLPAFFAWLCGVRDAWVGASPDAYVGLGDYDQIAFDAASGHVSFGYTEHGRIEASVAVPLRAFADLAAAREAERERAAGNALREVAFTEARRLLEPYGYVITPKHPTPQEG